MRAQTRRRLWIALILILVALPCAIRTIRLSKVPDVPEPFAVGREDPVAIPAESNAFGIYSEALERFETMPDSVFKPFMDRTEWTTMPEEVRRWLEGNERPLALFREASRRPTSFDDRASDSSAADRLDDLPKMRDMVYAAELEALRLEEADNVQEAWNWHRAALRSCYHVGMLGTFLERVTGATLQHSCMEGIARWSARPGVDEAMLRAALAEVRENQRLGIPLSKLIRSEYIQMQRAIVDPVLSRSGKDGLRSDTERLRWETQRLLWEPEISLRCSKLIYSNWLSQCDLPRPVRATIAPGKLALFEVSVGGHAGQAAVSAEEIERLIDSAPIIRTIVGLGRASTFAAIDRESAMDAILEVALALQLWHHQHENYPESLDELVGKEFDEIPLDPFGKGARLRYRRGTGASYGAKIWSIGDDEVDDEGRDDISNVAKRDRDIVIELKTPR